MTSQTSSRAHPVNLFESARGTPTELLRVRGLLEVQCLARRLLPKNNPVLRLPPIVPKLRKEDGLFRRWGH